MLHCKECNAPVPSESVITALDGYSSFFQCDKCLWWTQILSGTPEKGHQTKKFLLSKNAPFDLVTDDIARDLMILTSQSPDALGLPPINTQLAVLVQGIVCRFIGHYTEKIGGDATQALNYCVISGLHQARPQKEFSETEKIEPVVKPSDN